MFKRRAVFAVLGFSLLLPVSVLAKNFQHSLSRLAEFLKKEHAQFSQIEIKQLVGKGRGYELVFESAESAWNKPFKIRSSVDERPLEDKGTLDTTWEIETDTFAFVKHLSSLPESKAPEICPKGSDTPFCKALNEEITLLAKSESFEAYVMASPNRVQQETVELTDDEIGNFKMVAESGKRVITATPKLIRMHFHLALMKSELLGPAWELQLNELDLRLQRKQPVSASSLAKLISEQLEKIEKFAFKEA